MSHADCLLKQADPGMCRRQCVQTSGMPGTGCAHQAPALKAWGGKASNVGAGQQAYYHRARCNGAARYGKYTEAMEKAAQP